jgi:hypothetical protein
MPRLIKRDVDWPDELCAAAAAYEAVMADVLILPKKAMEDWERQVFIDLMKRVQLARDRFVRLRKQHDGAHAPSKNRSASPSLQF